MHLNDSVGRVDGLTFVCNHHEQASAMAAEGYARVANKPAIVNVTTGPGAINALNGVFWCIYGFYSNDCNIGTGKKRNVVIRK